MLQYLQTLRMSAWNSLPYLFKQNIPLHPQTATERNFSWRKLVEKPLNLGLLITLAYCGELADLGFENHCPEDFHTGRINDGDMVISVSRTRNTDAGQDYRGNKIVSHCFPAIEETLRFSEIRICGKAHPWAENWPCRWIG